MSTSLEGNRKLRNARTVLVIAMLLASAGSLGAQSLSVAVLTPPPVLNVATSQTTSGTTDMTVHTEWDFNGSYKTSWATTCIYMTQPLRGAPANTDSVPYTDVHVTRLTGPNAGSTVPMTNQVSCLGGGALVIGNTQLVDTNGSDPATRVRNGYRDDQARLQVFNVDNIGPDTYTGTIFVVALVHF